MARDPLAVLWRIREAAVTEASQDLSAARGRAIMCAQRLEAHRQHMRRERTETIDEHVADLAVWLQHARLRADELNASLAQEEAQVVRLQQILVSRRTDAEAVAKAIQRRQAETRLRQARTEQAIMDEAGGRRMRDHDAAMALLS